MTFWPAATRQPWTPSQLFEAPKPDRLLLVKVCFRPIADIYGWSDRWSVSTDPEYYFYRVWLPQIIGEVFGPCGYSADAAVRIFGFKGCPRLG